MLKKKKKTEQSDGNYWSVTAEYGQGESPSRTILPKALWSLGDGGLPQSHALRQVTLAASHFGKGR